MGQGNFLRAYSMLSNGSTKIFTSMLLFGASNAFDRTFVIPSCHVCNLVRTHRQSASTQPDCSQSFQAQGQ